MRQTVLSRSTLLDALGLSCYIAYSYVFWDSPLFLRTAGSVGSELVDVSLLLQGVMTAVAALVLLLFWARIAPFRRNLPALGVFCLAEVAAAVLFVLGDSGSAALVSCVGLALSGFGSGMRLGWEERMSVRGVGATAVRAALGYVFGMGIYTLVLLLPHTAGCVATIALPIASVAILAYQERVRPDLGVVTPDPVLAADDQKVSLRACFAQVPWRIPVFVALAYFCYGATRMDSLYESMTANTLWGGLTPTLAMFACATGVGLAYVSYRRSVQTAIYVAVPLLAAAGLCNALVEDPARLVVLYVANVGVEVTKYLMLYLMIDVIIKDGAPALLCLALLRLAQWGGSALGQGFASTVPSSMGVLVAMLVVLMLALMFVMGAFPLAGAGGQPEGHGARPAEGFGPAVRAPALDIEGFSKAYALSPRETDVLRIWVTGCPMTYVEKTLYISQNTVKTHLNHIYAKTGTANRAELVARLEGESDK